MSIWERIGEAISALAKGESLAAVFEKLRTPPEKSIGFTIAVIALGAKMAKADGQVTRNEVNAFKEVFTIPPGEEENAARAAAARRSASPVRRWNNRNAASCSCVSAAPMASPVSTQNLRARRKRRAARPSLPRFRSSAASWQSVRQSSR